MKPGLVAAVDQFGALVEDVAPMMGQIRTALVERGGYPECDASATAFYILRWLIERAERGDPPVRCDEGWTPDVDSFM